MPVFPVDGRPGWWRQTRLFPGIGRGQSLGAAAVDVEHQTGLPLAVIDLDVAVLQCGALGVAAQAVEEVVRAADAPAETGPEQPAGRMFVRGGVQVQKHVRLL